VKNIEKEKKSEAEERGEKLKMGKKG